MKDKRRFGFFDWVENHNAVSMIVVFIVPFFINGAIWIGNWLFQQTRLNLLNAAEITNNDWFVFLGSYVASVATIFLGYVALYQNRNANKVNEVMAELAKQATVIEGKMLNIEIDKKKPFLIIDETTEMQVRFFPLQEVTLIFPNGDESSSYMPLRVDEYFKENTLIFNISNNMSDSLFMLAKIDFSLSNVTENFIKDITLKEIHVRLFSDKGKFTNRFLEFKSPVCGKFIQKRKNVSVCIIQDEQFLKTINDLTKNDENITFIFEIYFIIKNIYDDSYQNYIGIILKSKLEKEGLLLRAFPVLLQANVTPISYQDSEEN